MELQSPNGVHEDDQQVPQGNEYEDDEREIGVHHLLSINGVEEIHDQEYVDDVV